MTSVTIDIRQNLTFIESFLDQTVSVTYEPDVVIIVVQL